MNLAGILPAILLLLVVGLLTIRYSFLIPRKKGLPILMYHKILDNVADGLTVTCEQFDLQLMYLHELGYRTIDLKTMKSLLDNGDKLPEKAIIITFDDAYRNFKENALPLLKKYDFKATVFVPVAYIGKTNIWDKGHIPIMTAADLKQLSNNEDIEIGLHSFLHRSWGDLSLSDMEEDLKNCRQTLEFYGISYFKALAYPYGGFPKKDTKLKTAMIDLFQKYGLDFALRIGNRINPWPIRRPFEIERIDIKGTENFFIFKTKLKKGRAKLF